MKEKIRGWMRETIDEQNAIQAPKDRVKQRDMHVASTIGRELVPLLECIGDELFGRGLVFRNYKTAQDKLPTFIPFLPSRQKNASRFWCLYPYGGFNIGKDAKQYITLVEFHSLEHHNITGTQYTKRLPYYLEFRVGYFEIVRQFLEFEDVNRVTRPILESLAEKCVKSLAQRVARSK